MLNPLRSRVITPQTAIGRMLQAHMTSAHPHVIEVVGVLVTVILLSVLVIVIGVATGVLTGGR